MWTNDLPPRSRALSLALVVVIVVASAGIAVGATNGGSSGDRTSLGAHSSVSQSPGLQGRHGLRPRRGLDRERDVVTGPAALPSAARIGLAETEPARAPDDRQRQAAVKLA